MDDIERRLRAAMLAAAELPPPGLVEVVRRRHRRHRKRVAAGWVASAAAVAIALPPTALALRTGAPPHGGPTGTATTSPVATPPPPQPTAAPGTVLAGCDSANPGAIGSTWHNGLRAGPLYFTPKNAAVSPRVNASPGAIPQLYAVVPVIVGLKPGSTVVVRAAPAGRGQIRFLFGPADSLAPGTSYTMRSGEAGVTFEACPPGTGFAGDQTVTDYYGGFLISGNACVPIEAWVDGRGRPFRTSLGACG